MDNKLIEIQYTKYKVILTKEEIQTLLKKDKEIWKRSIQRGKHITRSRKQEQRERAIFEKSQ